MKLSYWAIQHQPSGLYLPEPEGRWGRGGSHVEPTDPSIKSPRLFKTQASAAKALGAWLKGTYHSSSGYDSLTGEYWADLKIVPIPSRRRDEMRVVELTMELPR